MKSQNRTNDVSGNKNHNTWPGQIPSEEGIVVEHLELDAPSLDDVFADATGRRLEGVEAENE